MKLWYILQGDLPVPATAEEYVAWIERQGGEVAARRVAFTELETVEVSTVFLGIDHSFGRDGPPILWETMVFGSYGVVVDRYSSLAEAVNGHNRTVREWRRKERRARELRWDPIFRYREAIARMIARRGGR